LQEFGTSKINFLKIDVDGDDFALLKSFMSINNGNFSKALLGFEIESQFHGDSGEFGNTLDNILRLARNENFHLYKLDTNKYSRYVLPKQYVYDFPAQTVEGQVIWGDAVFIRDVADLSNLDDIVKCIMIYLMYDLDDCAIEAMLLHKEKLNLTDTFFEKFLNQLNPHQNKSRLLNFFGK